MPYLEIALAVVFASAFLKGGEMEARLGKRNNGMLWAAVSVLLSCVVVMVLGAGWIWLVLAQLGLFVAIGAVRVTLDERQGD